MAISFRNMHLFMRALLLGALIASVLSLPRRVAIIGSGTSGSATAYFLNRLAQVSQMDIETVVFADTVVRSTMIPVVDGQALEPTAFFHDSNRLALLVAEQLNLTFATLNEVRPRGIWNGQSFSYVESSSGFWNNAKLLWKYGRSPSKVDSLLETFTMRLNTLYDQPASNHSESVLDVMGLTKLLGMTMEEYLTTEGVSQAFVNDFVGAAMKVCFVEGNQVHALAGLIALQAAKERLHIIDGGSNKLCSELLGSCGARVRPASTVTSVAFHKKANMFNIRFKTPTEKNGSLQLERFDFVVMATPWVCPFKNSL